MTINIHNNSFKTLLSTALLSSVFLSPFSLANDLELSATTIPASACRPATDAQDALVQLKNGAYVFRSGQTGTANLLCPLPLSGWSASKSILDQLNDGSEIHMSSYRIYFKDPDRCSDDVRISTKLRYRKKTSGQISATPLWRSSNVGDGTGLCPGGTTAHTSVVVPHGETLINGRIYNFLVKLERDSAADSLVFTGIDFPHNIFIPQ